MGSKDMGKTKTSHLSVTEALAASAVVLAVSAGLGVAVALYTTVPESHEVKPAGEVAATFNIESLAQRAADEKAKQEKELREGNAWVESLCNDIRKGMIAPLTEKKIAGFTAEVTGHYAGKGMEACVIRREGRGETVRYLDSYDRFALKKVMSQVENAIIETLSPDEIARLSEGAKTAPSPAP